MKGRFISIIFIICFMQIKSFSQSAKDFGVWTKAGLEYKLNDKLNLSFSEGLRMRENTTRLNSLYSELGLEYKIVKGIKTSLSYRSMQRLEKENYFSYRHRFAWDVNCKYTNGRFTLGYRHRLQTGVRKYYTSKLGKIPAWNYRHRFQVKYEYNKRIEPFISAEVNFQLYDARQMMFNNAANRLRYQLGTDIKLNAKSSISIYYMIQDEFNTEKETDQYILGIEYSYKF
jgi:hypothetical protein